LLFVGVQERKRNGKKKKENVLKGVFLAPVNKHKGGTEQTKK
jgi:hypothetical protein